MNAVNYTKTSELSKSVKGNGGIFVNVCGICQGVDKMIFPKWHNWP